MKKIAIAILAAGYGSRFRGNVPKPLAVLGEKPLVSYALDASLASGLNPILLVVGHEREQVSAMAPPEVQVIYNPQWHSGIASSLGKALAALSTQPEIDACCIGLADQPFIGAQAYRNLAQAYQDNAPIAVATYNGARRNPVLLARPVWHQAMQLQGDTGAKQLMANYPVVEVECASTGNPLDIDTFEELQAVKRRSSGVQKFRSSEGVVSHRLPLTSHEQRKTTNNKQQTTNNK